MLKVQFRKGKTQIRINRKIFSTKRRLLIDSESMTAATKEIFMKMGLSEDDSQLSAEVLMVSDLRGCESYGVSNMLPIFMLKDMEKVLEILE